MAKNRHIHRILSGIRHYLTAWNTTGEGIHSPYLFRLVQLIIHDENAYYCFADIERRREWLQACEDVLDVVDYGSAGSKDGTRVQRRVSEIAKHHLESAPIGQMLFRIVRFMQEEQKRPLEVLELGTSLGITTSYLASVDSRNRIMTLEGSEAVLQIAQQVWRALRLENIEWHTGNIDNTLYIHAREQLDFVYLDANHTYEATMRYADYLLPRLTEKGVLVIDDIHYSEQMERAWAELKTDARVTSSMDLWHCGLLFVDTHYLKRHYRIII